MILKSRRGGLEGLPSRGHRGSAPMSGPGAKAPAKNEFQLFSGSAKHIPWDYRVYCTLSFSFCC